MRLRRCLSSLELRRKKARLLASSPQMLLAPLIVSGSLLHPFSASQTCVLHLSISHTAVQRRCVLWMCLRSWKYYFVGTRWVNWVIIEWLSSYPFVLFSLFSIPIGHYINFSKYQLFSLFSIPTGHYINFSKYQLFFLFSIYFMSIAL